MKALLIVIVMYVSEATTSFVQPMPTMQGCLEAATRIEAQYVHRQNGFSGKSVTAMCVENK